MSEELIMLIGKILKNCRIVGPDGLVIAVFKNGERVMARTAVGAALGLPLSLGALLALGAVGLVVLALGYTVFRDCEDG